MKLLTTLFAATAALALAFATPASACPGHDKAKDQDRTAEKAGDKDGKDDKATADADKDKKKPAKPAAGDKKKDAPKKDA